MPEASICKGCALGSDFHPNQPNLVVEGWFGGSSADLGGVVLIWYMVNPKSAHSRAKSVRLRVKSTSHLTKCYLIPQSLYQGVVVLKVTLNWTDVSQQVQCVFSRQHGLLHTRVSHRGSQCAHLCILPFPAPSLHRLQDCAPLFLWKLALWVEVKDIVFFLIPVVFRYSLSHLSNPMHCSANQRSVHMVEQVRILCW